MIMLAARHTERERESVCVHVCVIACDISAMAALFFSSLLIEAETNLCPHFA